ncbi:MAG: hypothetical protein FK730_07780 [Asgard group archaeon]|nr:hypothetical protein [Asgard group archaeon]
MANKTPFLVINPSADAERMGKKTDEILKIAKDIFGDFGYEMTKTLGDGIPIGHKAVKEGYKVLISVGGDGTLNELVNVAAKTDIKVGMVPGGSACDSHKTHGIPRDFTRAFEIISEGYSEKFPVGLAKGDTDRYFIEMINGAFIGQTSAALSGRFEHMHGELGYAYAAIHTAMRYKPIPSKITIDGKIIREVNVSAIAVALTDTIADFEFIPTNHPRLDDFAIFIGKDITKLRLVRMMLKAYNGKHLKNKNVEILRGKEVIIESEIPHIWESEGEIPSRNATKMEVTYLPDAINLIIPEGWKYGISKKERTNAKKNIMKRKPPFEC